MSAEEEAQPSPRATLSAGLKYRKSIGLKGVEYEGYLAKKGKGESAMGRRNWKDRWGVLRANGILEYYLTKEDSKPPQPKQPKGHVTLESVFPEDDNARHAREHCFVIHAKERDLYATGGSKEETNKWINAIEKVLDQIRPDASDDGINGEKGASPAGTPTVPSIDPIEEKIKRAFPKTIFMQNKSGKRTLKAASIDALLWHITLADAESVKVFLLTFRAYMEPTELLDRLKTLYFEERREGIEDDDKQIRIRRFKILNLLKTWLDTFYHDFKVETDRGMELLDKYERVVEETFDETGDKKSAEILHKLVHKKVERDNSADSGAPALMRQSSRRFNQVDKIKGAEAENKVPILPTQSDWTLVDIDPIEVARQLCLMDQELYTAIHPKELLNQAWSKKMKNERSPNVLRLIERFNMLSGFVTTEIVKRPQIGDRVRMISWFINIASRLLEFNNFNSAMAIIAGFSASPVYRLKKTWADVQKQKKLWQEYENVKKRLASEENFKALRENLHKADGACVPYLGVYLTDLTFIGDGNPDTVEEDGETLINFFKLGLESVVILEMQRFQNTPYEFRAVPKLQKLLRDVENMEENQAYKKSLEVEPREKKR
uniref:Uncharacterized protein n=1 Tax=Palpitomonas bilix TaxID=652834 RepID=A0A7S3D2F8_9EUKA|mmetsp:Transcript_19305/g.49513  ORF Transcript_19305/g.49513 Transcript_19305/m.49513 type:complete len:605 (+) Transcript_19305:453-2267(+)